MTPEQIDRVFGRGRLKMVTGEHVEVFREAAAPGDARRYTKRFLKTRDGDFAQWTEREWRILARLIGHGTRCVPDVVQYDRGTLGGTQLVQTYDAGPTVDQWATMLPVERDGAPYAHIFEDCAHWWALAHHCLVALDEIHPLQVVHLDVKGDNICIPIGPRHFDASAIGGRMYPVFRQLALIDFAFSLVSGESLTSPLPIGWQKDYDYQSPRLLQALEAGHNGDLEPTEDLDWRCDMYSLAAMLKRYLPGEARVHERNSASGWTLERYDAAKSLILTIRQCHDRELSQRRPHPELLNLTSAKLGETELAASLERGWTLARNAQPSATPALPLTPMTRIAPPLRLVVPPRDPLVAGGTAVRLRGRSDPAPALRGLLVTAGLVVAAVGVAPLFLDIGELWTAGQRLAAASAQSAFDAVSPAGWRAPSDPSVAGQGDVAATEPAATGPTATHEADVTKTSAAEPVDDAARPAETASAPSEVPATPSPAAQSSSSVAGVAPTIAGAASNESSAAASIAEQIEAHRMQLVPRSIASRRFAAPAPRPPPRSRLAEQGHRSLAVSPGKPSRAQSASLRNAVARPPAVLAAKPSTTPRYLASSPLAILTPPPAIPTLPPGLLTPPTARSADVQSPAAVPSPIVTQPPAVSAGDARMAAGASILQTKPPGPLAQGPVQPAAQPAHTPRVPAPTAPPPTASAQPVPRAGGESTPAPPQPLSPAVTFPMTPPVELPRAQAAPAPPDATASVPVAPVIEASRSASLAPRFVPPAAVTRGRAFPDDARDDDEDFLIQARRTLSETVPRSAAYAHAQIARVLTIAANAQHPAQDRAVLEATYSMGMATEGWFLAREVAASDARRLNDEARQAFWSRRQIPQALELQLKAFGANPNDAEIAGNLALLYLKVHPPQAERARQLALHAMAVRRPQQGMVRFEDWTTFAAASALTGREADARHALYASLSLTRNLDRSCRAALGALAMYGERLREPVEAMLFRLHAQGRSDESPYCAWPPSRIAGWWSR